MQLMMSYRELSYYYHSFVDYHKLVDHLEHQLLKSNLLTCISVFSQESGHE